MSDIFDELKLLCEEEKLIEMAKSKQEIERYFENKLDELLLHLFLIYFVRDDSLKHHIDEVFSLLNKTYKLKSSNKFPNYHLIHRNLWDDWQDNIKAQMNTVLGLAEIKYGSIFDINKFDSYLNFAKEYIDWLSLELSKKGFVSLKEVRDTLYELLD